MSILTPKKRCTRCGENKPLDDFYKSKRGLLGRKSTCKKCSYNKAQKAAYYQNHREGYLEKFKQYRQKFLDSIREREKAYQEANKEKRSLARAEYRKTHPEKERQWRRNKWARRFANGDRVTEKEWQEVLAKFGHKCVKCGSTEDITQDHVVPVSKGGRHIASNLQPLCRSCNSRKHTKEVDYR